MTTDYCHPFVLWSNVRRETHLSGKEHLLHPSTGRDKFSAESAFNLTKIIDNPEDAFTGGAEAVEIVFDVITNLSVMEQEIVLAIPVDILSEDLAEIVAADFTGPPSGTKHMVLDDGILHLVL